MKIRTGLHKSFSASFVLHKKHLSARQIEIVKNYRAILKALMPTISERDLWNMGEGTDLFLFETDTNNEWLPGHLVSLGIPEKAISGPYN